MLAFRAPAAPDAAVEEVVAVLRRAEEEMVRGAEVCAGVVDVESAASPPGADGDEERAEEPPGFRNGDAVRVTGVALLDGGFEGRLMVGLSQLEKKSSEGSPWGVEVPSAKVGDVISVMTTSSGNSLASAAERRFNSSLYLPATGAV